MTDDRMVTKVECERIQILLAKALDGELSPREEAALTGHLAACPSCREELAGLQALEVLLEGLAERRVEPGSSLVPGVMSRLPSRMERSWGRVLRPVAVAASLLLAVTAGFLGHDMLSRDALPGAGQQSVKIIFYSPEATSVALVGDFNEWGARQVAVARSSDGGMWEFTLALQPGVYHYNLLVDGQRWAANPKSATLVPDGFGGYDSVLVVSEKCQDDCT